MAYVYVFADKGVGGTCKIGTSVNAINRYRQARCHTPRGIRVEGMFEFSSTAQAKAVEKDAKVSFAAWQRPGRVREWFNMEPAEAMTRIASLRTSVASRVVPAHTPNLKSSDVLYDDWREVREAFAEFKWRLFLFRECGPAPRLKLSCGAFYDTAFRYAFTYNPWPVSLIAGFDDPLAPERRAVANRSINQGMTESWESLQKTSGSLFAEEVGWLKSTARPEDVATFLATRGFMPFNLDRPKPAGAPTKDASVPQTVYGERQPMHQVHADPAIYGARATSMPME